MTAPTGITVDQARWHIIVLGLLLAQPNLDADTERRASWLRMRLRELLPEAEQPRAYDFIDVKLYLMGAGELRQVA